MSDTTVLDSYLFRSLMSFVDTDVLSDSYGSPDPAHWREGRLKGPDPWTAGILYALSRIESPPELVDCGLKHLVARQDRNGAFRSERSEVEPTPWTALFLQSMLSDTRISRSTAGAVSLSVKKALSRMWEDAVLWPLPARIASLAAFAAAGDTKGVERQLRLVQEAWEEGPEVVPWMYQALWLLTMTVDRITLPSWLMERYEALILASQILMDGVQYPMIPVPQWDTPFVPFVLSMHGTVEESDRMTYLMAALHDDTLPMLAGSLATSVSTSRHDSADLDDNLLKLLKIRVKDVGAYRIVVFASIGAFAVINRESGHVVAWDQGITMTTGAGKRLSNAIFHEHPEIELLSDSMTIRMRLSAPVSLDIPVPGSVRKMISSGVDTISRHVPPLRRTGQHILILLERSKKMPVLERKLIFGSDGIGAVDTVILPEGHEVSGALLGAADYGRRFLGWFVPSDPSGFRSMTEWALVLMKGRGQFQLRRRFREKPLKVEDS